MFYDLLYPIHAAYGLFRVFRYISFRMMMAMLTALLISFVVGPFLIKMLKSRQIGEKIRSDGPGSHQGKSGTPTMGGILLVFSFLLSFLLWTRLDNPFTWVVSGATFSFALIGFLDDWLKIRGKGKGGLSISSKFKLQFMFAPIMAVALVWAELDTTLVVPFFKDANVFLPWFLFIPFAAFVIVATSNAVNLTDGLDGLAIGPVMVAAFTYMVLAYIAGHAEIADYLQVQNVKGAGELAVFCSAMVGAGLGFLWFNTYPAQVFMGDVGSLALGAALGTVAVIIRQELLLILVGGVFVVEAVSVIVQVVSFRTTGKRVFRMAPIHHHFELKGWAEPKVIVRFWIISIILAILALSTLKLR